MKQSHLLNLVLLTALGTGGITTGALAQDKRPVTIDDIMALRTVMDAQISPDGSQVLYVVSVPVVDENTHNSDVWLVSTDGGEPIQLSYSPKTDQSPRWSPDGSMVAFVSTREGPPQIYSIRSA